MDKLSKWRRFTQYPKLKNMFLTTGMLAERNGDLYGAFKGQRGIKFLRGLVYKMYGREGLGDVDSKLRGRMFGRIGGTISKNRIYIDPTGFKPGRLRETFIHEKFHTKPFIGKSEIFAHIAGGLGSKGIMGHKLKRAGHYYGHLWSSRPFRATMEHGLLAAPIGLAAMISGKGKNKTGGEIDE